MKKPLKRNDIIEVIWVDQSYYNGPVPPDGATERVQGYSVGHFIEEDKHWLCISAERFITENGHIEGNYRQIMTFPKVAIVEIKLLHSKK